MTYKIVAVFFLLGCLSVGALAQTAASDAESGTSNDLFIMFGSDLVRPGLLPKANYNIGMGHTFSFLKKDPFGDEITFGYTYENAGSHGFLHTDFGAHTEALGLMKNFGLPGTKRITGYTWIQTILTTKASSSEETGGRPGYCWCLEPSNFWATNRRYQPRIEVDGF